eukprot:2393092-Pleurochrysis_carterae.AAC.1
MGGLAMADGVNVSFLRRFAFRRWRSSECDWPNVIAHSLGNHGYGPSLSAWRLEKNVPVSQQ